MSSDSQRSGAFLPYLGERARSRLAALTGLGDLLGRVAGAAQGAFPEFLVDELDFLPFLARHVAEDCGTGEELLALRAADLYLLCACRRQDPRALEVLQGRYLLRVESALRRLGAPVDLIEDVKQNLCQRLLGQDEGAARYAGRGSLVGWLCVTAVREARHALRRGALAQPLAEGGAEDLAGAVGDQELVYMKTWYQAEFKAAFQEALASLSVRERNMLRYHYLDRLSIEQLSALHDVHPTTVRRRMARTRQRLLAGTRRALTSRIRVDRAELDSIFQLIQSQLDVSMHRLLRDLP